MIEKTNLGGPEYFCRVHQKAPVRVAMPMLWGPTGTPWTDRGRTEEPRKELSPK